MMYPTNQQLQPYINLLLVADAQKNLGLAHIINAESEKVEAAVQAYHQRKITFNELLEINNSVKNTLKEVTKNNLLSESKLDTALEISKLLKC